MERRGLGSEARRQRNLLMVAYVESGDPRCLHAELLIGIQSLGLTQEASTRRYPYYLDQITEAFDNDSFLQTFRYADRLHFDQHRSQ